MRWYSAREVFAASTADCGSPFWLAAFCKTSTAHGSALPLIWTWHDNRVADRRLLAQGCFQVFGINIQPRGRHDDVFLTAAEAKIAVGIHLAQVARMQPSFVSLAHRTKSALLPITRGNIFAAHQDFAVRPEPEFPPGKNFTDRSFRGVKWIVQADQRSGFRHAIALHHGVADAFEKILGV